MSSVKWVCVVTNGMGNRERSYGARKSAPGNALGRLWIIVDNNESASSHARGRRGLGPAKKPEGEVLLASNLRREGRIFEVKDVIQLLRVAIEREGNQSAFATRHGAPGPTTVVHPTEGQLKQNEQGDYYVGGKMILPKRRAEALKKCTHNMAYNSDSYVACIAKEGEAP